MIIWVGDIRGLAVRRPSRGLVSQERRESLLAEYDRSGMSGVKFAQYLGINTPPWRTGCSAWRQQRRKEKSLYVTS
jgi:hypothetical protein